MQGCPLRRGMVFALPKLGATRVAAMTWPAPQQQLRRSGPTAATRCSQTAWSRFPDSNSNSSSIGTVWHGSSCVEASRAGAHRGSLRRRTSAGGLAMGSSQPCEGPHRSPSVASAPCAARSLRISRSLPLRTVHGPAPPLPLHAQLLRVVSRPWAHVAAAPPHPASATAAALSTGAEPAASPAVAPPPPPVAASTPAPSGPSPQAAPAAPALASFPQLPLCMRPAVHVDELAAALRWKADMAARIAGLGDSLEQRDGGPDAAGLLRELDWALDDAIEAFRPRPDASWESTSWRMLEPLVRSEAARGRDTAAWQLRMRAPVAALREWWERRLRDRAPFQYLLSAAHWHTYVLSVGPGVLIPRPETEIFPALVSEALAAHPQLAAAPWADLGTGSGAIAVAAADVLRRQNPAAEVWAVDVSPTALAYAAFNAQLVLGDGDPDGAAAAAASAARSSGPHPHPPPEPAPAQLSLSSISSTPSASSATPGRRQGQQRNVRFALGSWCGPLRSAGLAGRLGGLLSNPPYIPRAQMAGLQAEVGRHEPEGALDGGEGPGTDSLQALCSQAAEMLMPGGLIALETAGGEQADLVADLLRNAVLPTERPGAAAGSPATAMASGTAVASGTAAVAGVFEGVEVLEDCYGVRRFVRAYRRAG